MMQDMVAEAATDHSVRSVELTELDHRPSRGKTLFEEHGELLQSVKVRLAVSVGTCELTVRELLELKEESILPLNRETSEPVDVVLDGKLVARGYLVAVDDNFGVRITEILPG